MYLSKSYTFSLIKFAGLFSINLIKIGSIRKTTIKDKERKIFYQIFILVSGK